MTRALSSACLSGSTEDRLARSRQSGGNSPGANTGNQVGHFLRPTVVLKLIPPLRISQTGLQLLLRDEESWAWKQTGLVAY